jgi:hypothetical protein
MNRSPGAKPMSGPIVRKYGFPNFEKIFGQRPIPHGGDEPQGLSGETPDDLVPDLAKGNQPADAKSASQHNEIAPSTEFGQAVE